MNFELMVAIRFLKESRAQTLLILAGIIVGVSVQVFLSSLITGLQTSIVESTVGDSPHILIGASENRPASFLGTIREGLIVSSVTESRTRRNIISYNDFYEELKQDSDLSQVSLALNQQAFISRGGVQASVSVKGIIFEDGDGIYRISERLVESSGVLSGNGIIIGVGLSENSGLEVNSILELRNSRGTGNFYRVVGIFDFESQQLNDSLVFMNLSAAQSFFQMEGMVSQIELQVPQVFDAEKKAEALRKAYPDFSILSWQESNQQLLSALRSQSSSSFVIQFFVILAITLGIASVLAINVVQKARQIGILKAMGATSVTASRIFIFQGAVLGFFGSLLGVVSGFFLIQAFIAGTSSVGGEVLFPIEIQPRIMVISIMVATFASMIAALIPARKAARLDPIEVIRNG